VETTGRVTAAADVAQRTSIGRGATSGATLTLASRVSGLIRVGVSAAILGDTFFGNLFLSANTLPNIVVSSLGWSVVSPLLVPALVRVADRNRGAQGRARAELLAGGFLSAQLLLLGVAAAIVIGGASPIGRLLTLGVKDPAALASIRRAAVILVFLVGPQVLLYGVIGVASAAQHAAGRFALPAGAPVIENLGVVAALAITAMRFGTGAELESHASSAALWLGIGSTLAVIAHATLQWFGAHRAGLTIRPRWAFDDPELRGLLRMAPTSVVSTALVDMRYFALAVACSTVAGGWIAFQISLQFAFFVPALFGRPVGTAMLAPLRRDVDRGDFAKYASQYRTGLRIVRVFSLPAGVALVVLSGPLARVVSVGKMGTPRGVSLVHIAIATIGLSVIAEAAYEVSRHASFARGIVSAPLRSTLVRSSIMVTGLFASLYLASHFTAAGTTSRGIATLGLLGLTVTLSDTASALVLHHLVGGRSARARGAQEPGSLRSLLFAVAAAVGSALVIERVVSTGLGTGWFGAVLSLGSAALTFAGVYGVWMFKSGVVGWLRAEWSGASAVTSQPAESVWGPPIAATGFGRPPEVRLRLADQPLTLGVGAILVAMAVGSVAAFSPTIAIGLAVVGSVTALVAARPAWAVYLYLAIFPFLAGIDRGRIVPLLRASEALQFLVTFGAILGLGARFVWSGKRPSIRIGSVDLSFIAMAVAGSVLPMAWLLARNESISMTDVLACVPLWRYLGLYALVRAALRTNEEMRRAVAVTLAAASAVAVIAMAQSFNVPGVRAALTTFWSSSFNPSEVANGRASTTFGSPIATATYLALSLGLAVSLVSGSRRRAPKWCGPVAVLLAIGSLATGQFTAVLAIIVVAVVTAAMAGRLGWLLRRSIPVVLLLGVLIWPVVQRRLGEVNTGSSLPESWVVRIDNLKTLYLPQFKGLRWLFGVRPDSVATPLDRGRQVAFLESGYLALLWVGGVPLLLAYFGFVAASTRTLLQRPRLFDHFGRSLGHAAVAAISAIAVLNLTDAHLTFRGGADVTFVLLAVAVTARNRQRVVRARSVPREDLRVAA
jgi:peptidoglycan biosynthesis protein MviN/MurJ (putative lipid II flippase)